MVLNPAIQTRPAWKGVVLVSAPVKVRNSWLTDTLVVINFLQHMTYMLAISLTCLNTHGEFVKIELFIDDSKPYCKKRKE